MYACIFDSAIDRRDNLHVVIGMASSSLEAFCSRCNQPTRSLCLVSHLFYTTVIFIRGANSLVTIITMILFSLFLRILAHGGSSATRSHRKATLAKNLLPLHWNRSSLCLFLASTAGGATSLFERRIVKRISTIRIQFWHALTNCLLDCPNSGSVILNSASTISDPQFGHTHTHTHFFLGLGSS